LPSDKIIRSTFVEQFKDFPGSRRITPINLIKSDLINARRGVLFDPGKDKKLSGRRSYIYFFLSAWLIFYSLFCAADCSLQCHCLRERLTFCRTIHTHCERLFRVINFQLLMLGWDKKCCAQTPRKNICTFSPISCRKNYFSLESDFFI